MQKRRYSMLAAAAVAASYPMLAKAAIITYYYDPSIQISTDGGNTFHAATVTGTTLNPVVHINPTDFLQVAIDGSISGNPNAASGGAYDTAHAGVVPANLGIAAFQIGINDSKAATAVVENAGYWNGTAPVGNNVTTAVANGNFTTLSAPGNVDGNGGVASGTGIYGANNAPTIADTTSTAGATLAYGAISSPANATSNLSQLSNTIYIGGLNGASGAAGTAVFSLLASAANQAYFTDATVGSSKAAPTYNNSTPTGSDTINLGTLTVIIGSASTSQSIVSLTATAPTSYGSQLGSAISITGGNGIYTVGNTGQVANPGQTTAFTKVSTFTPGTDKEVFALKLDQNGVQIATTNTTLIAAIISDINASNSGNLTASTVTGSFAALFPGYDVLLTAPTGVGSSAYLGVDFSQDTADPGLTVTEIAAVPEPATAAGIVLGAAGLLLGRRKNRVTAA